MIPRALLVSGSPASLGRGRRFYVYHGQAAGHGFYVERREVISDV